MQQDLQKFSSQANPAILAEMKEIAEKDKKMFQYVLEEAMEEYIARRNGKRPNPVFMAHLEATMDKYDELLHLLAK